jgi:hypothetical protein
MAGVEGDEDHAAAICANAIAIMQIEERSKHEPSAT